MRPTPSPSFALQPHLVGDLLELRPLRPEDWEGLFAAASDPLIWEQHPAYDRYREDVFREFFQGALDSGGALAAIDRSSQQIIGSSRYCGYDPEKREIEIGWTFLARSYWGGKYNGEMKRLMLEHAFQYVDGVVFVVGSTNLRSQKAMEKIGGVRIGRREATLRGEPVENVVYRIAKPAGT
jgi:RimJ/RimL family protein N-acetyltransferase